MKKQILTALLSGILACSFVAFTGCGDDNAPENPDDNTTQTPENPDGSQKPANPDDDKNEGNNPPDDGDDDGELTSTKLTGKVYVVGDSTVCDYSVSPQKMDSYYLNRYGYGTQLCNYLNLDSNQVVNYAVSGRSSLSYMTDSNGYYDIIKRDIKAGDYLIIGFGHNDSKSDSPDRFTDARGTYDNEEYTQGVPSFSYTVYENYVKMAEEKGATAIVCTPIVRYDSSGAYTGSKVHYTATGDYAEALKIMGEATGTTVIDLTTITKNIYKADNAAAAYFHAHTTYKGTKPNETPDGRDDTHINMYGAKVVAYNFAQALKNTDCTLKNHLNLEATAPTYENDFAAAINEAYLKPDYKGFDEANTTAALLTTTTTNETQAKWYGTYMGNVSTSGYIAAYKDGTFTVGNNGDMSGKLDSSSDGFGAAFVQVDINKNFTASATVKVTANAATSNKQQAAFGMMLRDDIYINEKVTVGSNYVAAASLGDASSVIFSRVSGKLEKLNTSNNISVNSDLTYTVSITKVGQEVVCAFSDGTHNYSYKYTDLSFVGVDNEYVYLCLFANRGIVAEFSNVNFEITGDSEGA